MWWYSSGRHPSLPYKRKGTRIPINNRLGTRRGVVVGGININSPTINFPDGVDVETIKRLARQPESQQYDAYEDSSPFSDEILAPPLPPNLKVNPDLYDDTTDRGLHLRKFIAEMQLYQHPHHLRCKYFPFILTCTIHRWYQRLLKNSITSWTHFYSIFLKQFQSTMTFIAPPNALSNIRQGDN